MKKIIFSIIFLILLIPLVFISLQERNPFPIVYWILKLPFDEDSKVKISSERYITFSKTGDELMQKFIETQGYILQNQMGAWYFFENTWGEKKVMSKKNLSKIYSIYTIE